MPKLFVGYMTEVGQKDRYFLQKGDILDDSVWPFHVSLAPPMDGDGYTERLSEALRNIAADTAPFRVVTGEPDLFGPQGDTPVRRIVRNEAIQGLHDRILGVLAARGAVDMTYAGEHYNPHSTYRNQGIYSIGFAEGVGMKIGGFTVFEKAEKGDAWRVVDKIRLKGRQSYIFLNADSTVDGGELVHGNPDSEVVGRRQSAMDLVGRLAVEEKARIVIISSYRYDYDTFDALAKALQQSGVSKDFYDRLYDWTPRSKNLLGREIDSWLVQNQESVLNYVVLDNAPGCNFLLQQLPYLISASVDTGFTMEQYLRARKILGRN